MLMCCLSQTPDHRRSFLAASEREVLYGGSAGGGKSYAMLADPLRYMGHPQFSGLLLRHTTEELRELIFKSQELYPKIWPGIKWSERKMQWTAPSGARLWMSYLDRDEDVLRYQGLAFSWIGFDELTQWAISICMELHAVTSTVHCKRLANFYEGYDQPRRQRSSLG